MSHVRLFFDRSLFINRAEFSSGLLVVLIYIPFYTSCTVSYVESIVLLTCLILLDKQNFVICEHTFFFNRTYLNSNVMIVSISFNNIFYVESM